MKKVFIAQISAGNNCGCDYGYNSDSVVNISEERFFEVSDCEYEKFRYFVNLNSNTYVMLDWIEYHSDRYASFLEQVNRAWDKKLKKEEELKAKQEKEKSTRLANEKKRKLKQLAKLQAELGMVTPESPNAT